MISIIICSRTTDISPALKQNIQTTIGIEYELVIIDNSKSNYSIFSAYNEGVKRAKFPYLCFMHEDVLVHTQDWGVKVIAHFENEKVGIIGVVGTHFLPKTISGWYHPLITSGGCLQREIPSDNASSGIKQELTRFGEATAIEAVAIDGMWFCIPKKNFEFVKFDVETFSGFHFYDLDICLQIINLGLSVNIISDILIEHFSYGSFDIKWISQAKLFFDKWEHKLPIQAGVFIDDNELKIRTDMVAQTFVWITANAQSQNELNQIRKSKAYRLGKNLIKLFSWIK